MPRIAGSHERREKGMEWVLPQSLQKELTLPTTLILGFCEQNCEQINLCCFKLPSLCYHGPISQTWFTFPLWARTTLDNLTWEYSLHSFPWGLRQQFIDSCMMPRDTMSVHLAGVCSPAEETWGPLWGAGLWNFRRSGIDGVNVFIHVRSLCSNLSPFFQSDPKAVFQLFFSNF